MTDVRLEDILEALSKWSIQEIELKDRVRLLEATVQQLGAIVTDAIRQTQEYFELPINPAATLQLVIQEALLSTKTHSAEKVRTIAAQKDQIDTYAAKIAGMEEEVRESIDRMVAELQLPPNRHRTLRNAATEVCTMIVEARKMVQENL